MVHRRSASFLAQGEAPRQSESARGPAGLGSAKVGLAVTAVDCSEQREERLILIDW